MTDKLTDALRQHLLPRLTLCHLAAVLLLAAGAAFNAKFGYGFGSSGGTLDGLFTAGASLGADIYNAIGLILISSALAGGTWQARFRAALCAALLACTVAYSIQSGLGYAAGSREGSIGVVAAKQDTHAALEGSRIALQGEIAALGTTRPVKALEAQAAKILADPRADGCRTMNGPYTRANCPTYFDIQAEIGRAGQIEAKTAELAAVNAKLATRESKAPADPLGETMSYFAGLIGYSVKADEFRPWQALLFVVIVVLGGPITLWAAESSIAKPPVKPSEKPLQTTDEPVKLKTPKPAGSSGGGGGASVEEPSVAVEDLPKAPPERIRLVTSPALSSVPPAQRIVDAVRERGGTVHAKTQRELAEALGLPKTTFIRGLPAVEAMAMVEVQKSNGWSVTVH